MKRVYRDNKKSSPMPSCWAKDGTRDTKRGQTGKGAGRGYHQLGRE